MFIWSQKLKKCRKDLSEWSKEEFGNNRVMDFKAQESTLRPSIGCPNFRQYASSEVHHERNGEGLLKGGNVSASTFQSELAKLWR